MDLRGLTTKELAGYGDAIQKYIKDPEFQKLIDDFATLKGLGSGNLPEAAGVDKQLRMYGIDKSGSGDKLYPSSKNNQAVRKFISDKEVTKGIYNPATTLTDAQKKYLEKLKVKNTAMNPKDFKLAGIPAKMLKETKGVVKNVGSAVPFAGPAMAAGEVLAGENDLGKMAAGLAGSEILGTLASMVPGSGVTKGIMAGTGAVAGYPVGQEVYKKVVPESVQEKLKLSPEERTKIKEMLSKMKKKVF
jgi:hypothetical protein